MRCFIVVLLARCCCLLIGVRKRHDSRDRPELRQLTDLSGSDLRGQLATEVLAPAACRCLFPISQRTTVLWSASLYSVARIDPPVNPSATV